MSQRAHRTQRPAATLSSTSYLSEPSLAAQFRALPTGSAAGHRWARAVREAADQSAHTLPGQIERVRTMIGDVDALRVLGALHELDNSRRAALRGPENFGSDAMLEFFAGLVTSRPETEIVNGLDRPFDPQRLWDIDVALRAIANAQMSIDRATALDKPESPLQRVQRLLRTEHHFDRMSGFDVHLRRVATAVLAHVDEPAHRELGFALSDSLRFADAYMRRQAIRVEHAYDLIDRLVPPPPPGAGRDEQEDWMAAHCSALVISAAAPLELEADEALAADLGMSQESFTRLVAAMATPLGSQHVNDLDDTNTVRNRPILQLASGEWQWCRPVDFIHTVLDWAFETCRDTPALLSKFDKARQTVAEQLPAQILSDLYGARAYSNVRYTVAGSNPDIDALVALPGAAIVVECKGGRFTPPARRGAPGRIETHAKQIVDKAADQNARAMTAIADGIRLTAGKGRIVATTPGDQCVSIIVTLDRIDPFSTHLGLPSNGDASQRSLMLALSDVLMIAEILPTPAEFFAYLAHRLQQVRTASHLVLVEADALGAWCDHRMTGGTPLAPGLPIVLDTTSDAMNDYYADRIGDPEHLDSFQGSVARPSAHIPPEVLRALDESLKSGAPCWAQRCEQVGAVLPEQWTPFQRIIANSGRPADRLGRATRRNIQRARRGYVLAGKVPIRLGDPDAPATTAADDYLLIQP